MGSRVGRDRDTTPLRSAVTPYRCADNSQALETARRQLTSTATRCTLSASRHWGADMSRKLSLLLAAGLLTGMVLTPVSSAHAREVRAAHKLFSTPAGLALDARGNLWVVDSGLNRVIELSPAGKVLKRWGKTSTTVGQIKDPNGIAVGPDGDVWVSSQTDTPSIEKFSPSGKYLLKRDGAGIITGLGGRITLDRSGNLWIALGGGVSDIPDVVELSPAGKEIIQWQAPHKKTTTKDGIAVDSKGFVYLSSETTNLVYKYTARGKFLGYVAKHGQKLGQVDSPEGLAVDTRGNLYIAEQGNSRAQEISARGKPVRAFGDTFSTDSPQAVAVSAKGTVYLLDQKGVHVYTPKGKQTAYWQ